MPTASAAIAPATDSRQQRGHHTGGEPGQPRSAPGRAEPRHSARARAGRRAARPAPSTAAASRRARAPATGCRGAGTPRDRGQQDHQPAEHGADRDRRAAARPARSRRPGSPRRRRSGGPARTAAHRPGYRRSGRPRAGRRARRTRPGRTSGRADGEARSRGRWTARAAPSSTPARASDVPPRCGQSAPARGQHTTRCYHPVEAPLAASDGRAAGLVVDRPPGARPLACSWLCSRRVVLLSSFGSFVADTKPELYLAPWRSAAAYLSAWQADPQLGFPPSTSGWRRSRRWSG